MELTQDNVFDNFLYLRTKYGVSQLEVCSATGISKPTLSGFESGRTRGNKPQKQTILKLNQYFKSLGE